MDSTYKYSVLRLTLDERRGETVNIGVVVFKDDGCDVRLLPSMRKVQALNANLDIENLYHLKSDIPKWINRTDSPEQAHKLLAKFGGVSVSELGWFKAQSEETYSTAVDQIMSEMVLPPFKRRSTSSKSRLSAQIRKTFKKKELLGASEDDIDNHRLVPNYPVSNGLQVDFALKNGVYHVTETIDFRVTSETIKSIKLKEVGLKAITLDLALADLGKDTMRSFVYAARVEEERQLSNHLSLMEKYADRVFNFESRDDQRVYVDYTLSALGERLLVT